MNFLQRNLFIKLRSENFGTDEELEPMTTFKMHKIAQMMKNLSDIPEGEVRMNNSFLNRRLTKIQDDERHAIDTSIETVYLLRIIVGNVNSILPAHERRQGRLRETGEMAYQTSHPAHRTAGRKRAHHLL